MINLDVRQSRQANYSASIVKHTKERDFAIAKVRESAARGQIGTPRLAKELESVDKLFLSA